EGPRLGEEDLRQEQGAPPEGRGAGDPRGDPPPQAAAGIAAAAEGRFAATQLLLVRAEARTSLKKRGERERHGAQCGRGPSTREADRDLPAVPLWDRQDDPAEHTLGGPTPTH